MWGLRRVCLPPRVCLARRSARHSTTRGAPYRGRPGSCPLTSQRGTGRGTHLALLSREFASRSVACVAMTARAVAHDSWARPGEIATLDAQPDRASCSRGALVTPARTVRSCTCERGRTRSMFRYRRLGRANHSRPARKVERVRPSALTRSWTPTFVRPLPHRGDSFRPPERPLPFLSPHLCPLYGGLTSSRVALLARTQPQGEQEGKVRRERRSYGAVDLTRWYRRIYAAAAWPTISDHRPHRPQAPVTPNTPRRVELP